jgi:hypothetical protein
MIEAKSIESLRPTDCDAELLIIQTGDAVGLSRTQMPVVFWQLWGIRDQLKPSALKVVQ